MAKPDLTKLVNIFLPGHMEKRSKVKSENIRFAYYTSADTAMKIIKNGKIWLRSTTVMNDFSEIKYGIELTKNAFSGPSGKAFEQAINGVFPDIMEKAKSGFDPIKQHIQCKSYLTCLSVHKESEDTNGRLSMWRAYGDIAIVIKYGFLINKTDLLNVNSTPVYYLDKKRFNSRLEQVTKGISENSDYLMQVGEDLVLTTIKLMFFLAAIGTKHPGFKEEKEWRIFHDQTKNVEKQLPEEIVIINGVPQQILKLPFKIDPLNDRDSDGDVAGLLDRIIIGPTQYPKVSRNAFVKLLVEAGVKDANDKVIESRIPLRTHG